MATRNHRGDMDVELDAIVVDPPIGRESRSREVDRVIAGLAERQHGVVARRQLLELGIGGGAIDKRVARRRLHVVHRGVYAVGHRLLSLDGRRCAAVLACGPGAVLSHRSAAEAWMLLPVRTSSVEVTRPTGGDRRPGIRIHRSGLRPDELDTLDGIPITGLSRTFLDLAAVVTRSQLEQAWNEAEVRGLTDRVSIPVLLKRYPRRPGTAVLRRLLADEGATRGITRKELEKRFRAVLDMTDLPRPRLNADLAVRGRFFEADCLWPKQRLIIELDGRAVHGTGRAFEKDRERDRVMQAEGWRVARITWRQLRDEAPAVVADLRRMLATS
jgi:very-short-patch-repair endonuclease